MEYRIARFHEGALDLVDDIPSELAARLTADPRAESVRTGKRTLLYFNSSRRPFTELSARQAFAASIARYEPLALLRRPDLAAAGFFWPAPGDGKSHGPEFAAAASLAQLKKLPFDIAAVHPSIAWTPFPGAVPLVDNLVAQWAKHLKVRIEPVGSVAEAEISMSGAAMTLVEIDERVLTPWRALSRFAAGHFDVETKLLKAAHARDEAELEAALESAETALADRLVVAVPLLAQGRTILRAARVKRLTQTPLGAWDFASTVVD
jgi:hypothetical protein